MNMTDILFLSLVQDINSLESLILKIYDLQKDSSFSINSWRLPTKHFLNAIHFNVDETQPTTLQYTTILEVVIDRLYVLLNQYLEHTTNAITKCSSKGVSGRPQKISLGALNHNLWEKLESICDLNKIYGTKSLVEDNFIRNNKTIAILDLEVVNKESQTEHMPSSQCNSCFVAINCIKSMSRQMELILPDSFTEKNRKQLEPNIYELTQFGCMNSIITALLADVNVLAESIQKSQRDRQEELTKNSMLKSKMESATEFIANLEIDLTTMENKNEKLLGEIENYKSEIHSKNETENTYKDLLKTLPQELQVAKDKATLLQNELVSIQYSESILKNQIGNLQKQQELIIVERDMWKLRFNSCQDENNKLKLQNEDLRQELASLSDSVERTEESYRSMNLLMEVSASKMDEKIQKNESLLSKLHVAIDKKIVLQEQEIVMLKKSQSLTSVTSVIPNFVEKVKVQKQDNNQALMKGNPIEDMTKQIEVNNLNMTKLKAQNDTLIHTINKLQSIQVKKRLSIF